MKITTKTIHSVDYNEVDRAINDFLRSKGLKPTFEMVADEELMNNISKTYNIEKEQPSEYDMGQIQIGRYGFQTRVLLNWMAFEEVIPEGEYVVEIFW